MVLKQLYKKHVLQKYVNTDPSQSELCATVYRSQSLNFVRVSVKVNLYH